MKDPSPLLDDTVAAQFNVEALWRAPGGMARAAALGGGWAMALTAEQYAQLTQILSSPPHFARDQKPYEGAERRESPRLAARGPAELYLAPPDGAARAVTVYVHDVSPGGLGLLSGTRVDTGSAVRVVVTNGHNDVTVCCSVKHCTTLAKGLYGLGVNVDDYDARQCHPDAAAPDEATAAWSGFFSRQAAASSKGLT